MSINNNKRPRCSNFSATEENTLVELAAKHASVLECKKSDHDIWQAKNVVWKKIQDQFTVTTGSKRSRLMLNVLLWLKGVFKYKNVH